MATFNPGTDIVKVPRDGTVTFSDSGASNTFTVDYEKGDFKFSRTKADRIVGRDRGAIAWSRKGDDPVLTFSFSVNFRQFKDSRTAKAAICDVLDGAGAVGSAWTKVSNAHEEWNLNLTFTKDGTPYTGADDGANHTAVFSTCVFTWDYTEDPSGDSITVNGECMGGVTFTGPA